MNIGTSLTNRQVRLAQRPVGMPGPECWAFTSEPVAEPADGGVLVKTLALSLDPAMRGWMNEGKSYIPPVGIGEVMRAGGVGKVVASRNPKFAAGDIVSAMPGVQEYCLVPEDQIRRSGLQRIDLRAGTLARDGRAAAQHDEDRHSVVLDRLDERLAAHQEQRANLVTLAVEEAEQ